MARRPRCGHRCRRGSSTPTASSAKDNATEPVRALPAVRALLSGIPSAADGRRRSSSRPTRSCSAGARCRTSPPNCTRDGTAWSVRKLEFRAPGSTRVSLSGARRAKRRYVQGRAQRRIHRSRCADRPGCRAAAISPIAARSRCGCAATSTSRRTASPSTSMKAEFDGGAVEGRVAISHPQPDSGARVEADLKSERLDLDAATALLRSLGGPQGEWPEEAQLSLDVGRAVVGGAGAAAAAGKTRLWAEDDHAGAAEDRAARQCYARRFRQFRSRQCHAEDLALNSSAASFSQLTALINAVRAVAGRAAERDGGKPRPGARKTCAGAARRAACRPRQCAGRARSRRAAVQGHHDDRGAAAGLGGQWHRPRNTAPQRARGRNQTVVRRRAARCLSLLGLDRAIAAGEGPCVSRAPPAAHGARRCS